MIYRAYAFAKIRSVEYLALQGTDIDNIEFLSEAYRFTIAINLWYYIAIFELGSSNWRIKVE